MAATGGDDRRPVASKTIDPQVAAREMHAEAMHEGEDKFRTVSASAQDAVIVLDEDGRITDWNPAAERIFGYRAAEVVGQDLHTLLALPHDDAAARRGWQRFRKAGTGPVVGRIRQVVAVRRDGIEVPVELSVSSVQLRGERHAIGILRDVTERKRAEARLQRLNRELRAIYACNQVLVRAEDEQTLLDDLCRTICDEAGYRMAWVGFAERDDALTVRPAAWAGVEDGYLTHADITWADTERGRGPTGTAIRTGTTIYAQDYATDPRLAFWRERALARGFRSSIALPLRDAHGVTFGALTLYASEPGAFTPDELRLLEELASDLAFGIIGLRVRAERKRADEVIRTLNAELEERVAQRTAALELANQELESFGYSVSHDLRAPLRAIAGFTSILERRYGPMLDAEGRRLLRIVAGSAVEMAGLIDGLLALSRVGRAELRSEVVDMDGMVRSVVAEAVTHEPERTVQVDVDRLPAVIGDPAVLRQVWVNLIGNALKFTRATGDARIVIHAEIAASEVAFTVRDNGAGFDPRHVQKLFGVFQRLHTTDEFEGTGIGLAIVARIVTRHGGRVWADGAPGAGAVFGFSLPRKAGTPGSSGQAAAPTQD